MTTRAERKAQLVRDLESLNARLTEGGPDIEAVRTDFDDKIAELEAIAHEDAAMAREDTTEPRGALTPSTHEEPAPPRSTTHGVLWRVRELTARLGYPPIAAVHGRALDNLAAWERVLSSWSFSTEQIESLNRQLDSFQVAAHVRERFERTEHERAASLDQPDPMAAVHAEERAEAERIARYRRSPEGRAERAEELLTEIRDLLRESLQVRQS